jgi:hypothetical protein
VNKKLLGLTLLGAYYLWYSFAPLVTPPYLYYAMNPLYYVVPPFLVLLLLWISSNNRIVKIVSLPWIWLPIMIVFSVISSYQSLGLVVAVIVVTLFITDLTRSHKLLLALCTIWTFVGIWEVVFNLCLYLYHPGSYTSLQGLLKQEMYSCCWIMAGVASIVYLKAKYPSIILIKPSLLSFGSVSAILFGLWLALGMPCETVWVYNTLTYPTTNIWLSGVLVHASKIIYLIPAIMV